MPPTAFHLGPLRNALRPFRLHWFPRLRSTNDHAAELRRRGQLFAPAVVLTGRQTAGRGRGTNAWWSTGGVLTVTFVLPTDDMIAPHQVPLLAGLAVRNAVAALLPTPAGAAVRLKWPNDLLCDGRKLAGLLCERVGKADLVGLGLNVNVNAAGAPRHLRGRIASLSEMAGRSLAMNDVLAAVASGLRATLLRRDQRPFATILREYDEHHALLGRRVTVRGNGSDPPLTGRVEGLDAMGRLLLRDHRTLHRIIAGQVQIL